HPHRAFGREREQTRVDLERDVLACAERAADAGEDEVHLRFGQPQAGRDLAKVLVQPLRRDVELDAAVLPRDGEPGLRSKRRLILHPELVLALNDDVRSDVWITVLAQN